MSPVAAEAIGPYKVLERLSERSAKALTAGGRELVLKAISKSDSPERAAGRYARAREIMHPSLANVVGIEEHGGERYLVYQFVKGLAVDDWVRAKGPSRAAIARLVRDAAETLDYIHKQGVVHGRPGAGNLIVTARGGLRVVDIAPDPVADPVVDVKCLGELLRGALAAGGSDTSDDLDRIIERATGGSYASARAMAEDLRNYCDGRALHEVAERRAPPVFLRREFLVGMGALGAAAVLFVVLLAVLGSGEEEADAGRARAGNVTPTRGTLGPSDRAEAATLSSRDGAVPPSLTPPRGAARDGSTPGRRAPYEDGFEATGGWAVLDWGNSAETVVMQEGDNKTLLVRSPSGGSKDKAVVYRATEMDLSGKRAMRLRVENGTARRVAFAFAVTTKEGYFEALPVMLAPGWNEDVSFELGLKIYKAESTQWKHEVAVGGRSAVTGVCFIVYNGGIEADVRLDAIRFE